MVQIHTKRFSKLFSENIEKIFHGFGEPRIPSIPLPAAAAATAAALVDVLCN